jgi:hypothetical protein
MNISEYERVSDDDDIVVKSGERTCMIMCTHRQQESNACQTATIAVAKQGEQKIRRDGA